MSSFDEGVLELVYNPDDENSSEILGRTRYELHQSQINVQTVSRIFSVSAKVV
jgi:hypothetical protein